MRYYDNGSGFTVSFTDNDAFYFVRSWPGSGIDGNGWFAFDNNGDLIDMGGKGTRNDGGDLSAWADICKAYGLARRSGKSAARARYIVRHS